MTIYITQLPKELMTLLSKPYSWAHLPIVHHSRAPDTEEESEHHLLRCRAEKSITPTLTRQYRLPLKKEGSCQLLTAKRGLLCKHQGSASSLCYTQQLVTRWSKQRQTNYLTAKTFPYYQKFLPFSWLVLSANIMVLAWECNKSFALATFWRAPPRACKDNGQFMRV